MEFSSVIGDIYEAGSRRGDWRTVGRKLLNCFGADAGSLRLKRQDEYSFNVFEPSSGRDENHAERGFLTNSIRAAISRISQGIDCPTSVAVSSDLINDRSDSSIALATPQGPNYMLIGSVGGHDTVVGFFRQACEFNERDKLKLASLLPHIQRSLQMAQRVHKAELEARVAYTAFEALPGSAVVVDAELNVLYANSTADRTLSRKWAAIGIKNGPRTASAPKLMIGNRDKAAQLRSLVCNASNGGRGGALRLELDSQDGDRVPQLAIFVSPQPAQFASQNLPPGGPGPVLILIKELNRPSAPKPSLLCDLFGLSTAEGAVALALMGGQTAESVARVRDVSLDTIRSQIRTVLRKTDATNLRDLERIGALLTTLSR